MPWPVPWPKCSPWPAASMTARAAASTSRPLGAGAAPRAPRPSSVDRRLLRRGHDVVDRQVARDPARRRRASASCRSGSRPPSPRSRTGAPARVRTSRSDGEPCGRAAFGTGQAGDPEGQGVRSAGAHLPLERQRQLALRLPGLDPAQDRRRGPGPRPRRRPGSARSRTAPSPPDRLRPSRRPRPVPRPGPRAPAAPRAGG